MSSKSPTKLLRRAALLACLAPAAAFPQSLGSLLKTFQQATANSSDTLNAIKSIGEAFQGQVTPGTQAENAEGKIVLYRTSWCPHCKNAAAYMQQKNMPFVERDIANPVHNAEYKKLGGKGIPFTVFGQKTMHGFSAPEFDKNYAEFQSVLAAAPKAAPPTASGTPNGHAGGLEAGQPLVGKISGIKVYTQANKTSAGILVLGKADEVIYMGEEREGLYRVTTQKGEGWVDKLLVKQP